MSRIAPPGGVVSRFTSPRHASTMSRPSSSFNSDISSIKSWRLVVLLASIAGATLIAAILALQLLPWWQVLLYSAAGATGITVLLTLFAFKS